MAPAATAVEEREEGALAEGLEAAAKEGVERERGERTGAEKTAAVAAAAEMAAAGKAVGARAEGSVSAEREVVGTVAFSVSGTAPVLPQSTMCCHKAPLAISRGGRSEALGRSLCVIRVGIHQW